MLAEDGKKSATVNGLAGETTVLQLTHISCMYKYKHPLLLKVETIPDPRLLHV